MKFLGRPVSTNIEIAPPMRPPVVEDKARKERSVENKRLRSKGLDGALSSLADQLHPVGGD